MKEILDLIGCSVSDKVDIITIKSEENSNLYYLVYNSVNDNVYVVDLERKYYFKVGKDQFPENELTKYINSVEGNK